MPMMNNAVLVLRLEFIAMHRRLGLVRTLLGLCLALLVSFLTPTVYGTPILVIGCLINPALLMLSWIKSDKDIRFLRTQFSLGSLLIYLAARLAVTMFLIIVPFGIFIWVRNPSFVLGLLYVALFMVGIAIGLLTYLLYISFRRTPWVSVRLPTITSWLPVGWLYESSIILRSNGKMAYLLALFTLCLLQRHARITMLALASIAVGIQGAQSVARDPSWSFLRLIPGAVRRVLNAKIIVGSIFVAVATLPAWLENLHYSNRWLMLASWFTGLLLVPAWTIGWRLWLLPRGLGTYQYLLDSIIATSAGLFSFFLLSLMARAAYMGNMLVLFTALGGLLLFSVVVALNLDASAKNWILRDEK